MEHNANTYKLNYNVEKLRRFSFIYININLKHGTQYHSYFIVHRLWNNDVANSNIAKVVSGRLNIVRVWSKLLTIKCIMYNDV